MVQNRRNVCDGPARGEVEALLARRLPPGRVTFAGRVEGGDLAALYAGSDLFVWPAVGEAMGMAMLEAQGRGLPVVAGRTRAAPELVRDGETGRLVPEGDAEAFADAVRTLLRAPERRRRMGDAARVRVAREHSFAAASERIGALVEALIRRDAEGPPQSPEPPPGTAARRCAAKSLGHGSAEGATPPPPGPTPRPAAVEGGAPTASGAAPAGRATPVGRATARTQPAAGAKAGKAPA